MTIVLLDTHALHWWSAAPDLLSDLATRRIEEADEVAVSAVTWFELGRLATHDRITVAIPVRSWLERLARDVRTLPITPAVTATAVALPASFPGDLADRLIYATAVEHGCQLVTKDRRMRAHRHPRDITVW